MEGDDCRRKSLPIIWHFNPLPPHGGRLNCRRMEHDDEFISIHSLRMEGDKECYVLLLATHIISIHSLRMEGDARKKDIKKSLQIYFNPLPPHGGRRVSIMLTFTSSHYFNPLPPHGGRRCEPSPAPTTSTFQSTPSAWRETISTMVSTKGFLHFNPLPPHGGRHRFGDMTYDKLSISIHSLRMEGDCLLQEGMQIFHCISIHSLRMEGDGIPQR